MGLFNIIFFSLFIPIYSIYTISKGKNVNEKLLLQLIVVSSVGTVHDSLIIWALYLCVVLYIVFNGRGNVLIFSYLRIFFFFLLWMIVSFVSSTRTSFYFGFMMVVKFAVPIFFFIAAYKTFVNKKQILDFYEKVLKLWPFYLILGLCSVKGQNIDHYFLYFGMLVIFIPYVLYKIRGGNLRKYIFIAITLMIPAILFPKRTPIIGCMIGCTIVLILRYKLKAVVPILMLSVLPVVLLFTVPQLKEKFFVDSSLTFSDFLEAGVEFENINSNGRTFFWGLAYDKFYKNNEIIGSGTGSLKTYMRSSENQYGDSFQLLHNDWLHILCENGIVGVILLLIAMISTLVKCYKLLRKNMSIDNTYIFNGLCICFGGVVTHMFFENCINSYAFPFYFVFYAMTIKYLRFSLIQESLTIK